MSLTWLLNNSVTATFVIFTSLCLWNIYLWKFGKLNFSDEELLERYFLYVKIKDNVDQKRAAYRNQK